MTLADELRARRRADDASARTRLSRADLLRRCRRRLAATLAAWGAAILAVGALGSVAVEAALQPPVEASELRLEAVPPEVAPGESAVLRLWLEGFDGRCSASADHVVTVVLATEPPVLRLARGTVTLARCAEEHAVEVGYEVAHTEPVEVAVTADASGGQPPVDTVETVTVAVRMPPTNRVVLETPQREILVGAEVALAAWLAPTDDGTCFATSTDPVTVALSAEPAIVDLAADSVTLEDCGEEQAAEIALTAAELDDEQAEVQIGATATGGVAEARFAPTEPLALVVRAPEANHVLLDAFPVEVEGGGTGALTVWLEPGAERTCNATADHPVDVAVSADPDLLELATAEVSLEDCGRSHAATVDYTAADIGDELRVEVTLDAEPSGGVPGAAFEPAEPETVTIIRVVQPNRLQLFARPTQVLEGGEGELGVSLLPGAADECYATEDAPVRVTLAARPALLRITPEAVTLTGCGSDHEETVDYVAGATDDEERVDVEVTAVAPDAEPAAPIEDATPVTVTVRAAEPNAVELEARPPNVEAGGEGDLTIWLVADAGGCHATEDAPVDVALTADPDDLELADDSVTLEGCGRQRAETMGFRIDEDASAGSEIVVRGEASGGVSGARFSAGEETVTVLANVE